MKQIQKSTSKISNILSLYDIYNLIHSHIDV